MNRGEKAGHHLETDFFVGPRLIVSCLKKK